MTDFTFKTEPRPYQLDAFNRSKHLKSYGLLMDMGTGKTKVAIDTVAYLRCQNHIDGVLVFGNKGSYRNWEPEFEKHLADNIPRYVAIWDAQAKKEEMRRIGGIFQPNPELLKIFIVNIEALSYKRSEDMIFGFLNGGRIFTIIDESTTIKNHKAKRTKKALEVGKLSVGRRILTGTCIDNSPLNAWSQFEFLNPGCLGHKSFYTFRAEFAILKEMQRKDRPRPFKTVVGYRNLEKLKTRLGKNAFVLDKKDANLGLPPKIYMDYKVELSDEQNWHHQKLKKDAYTYFETGTVSPRIALTKLIRLQQLLCGYLVDDDGNFHKIKHNRIKALGEILDETSSEKIVVWSPFRPALDEIIAFIEENYGAQSILTYHGDTSIEDRKRVISEFQRGTSSKVRFMAGNPAIGGFGLNMTAVELSIYYMNNFDGEIRRQSEDRCHRIGQTESVTYMDIVVPNTVDEKLKETLTGKKKISEQVIVSNWKEYLI